MIELLLSSILFSLSFGLIKAEISNLDPFGVGFIRLFLSFLAFAPFLRRVSARVGAELMLIGFVQLGIMYCLYISSFHWLAGHQVAILTSTSPLFVILIDTYLEERFERRSLYAAAIAMIAALIAVWDHALSATLLGFALVQGANICFSLGQLLYRRTRARHGLSNEARSFAWLYAGAFMAPLLALLFEATISRAGLLPGTIRQWGALAYLGLIPSGLGFFLWNRGVSRVPASVIAVMNNAKVPLGVVFAWVLFSEKIDVARIAASLLLMGIALAIAQRSIKTPV